MEGAATAWHSLEAADVVQRLDSDPLGLDGPEAVHRLERFGPNRLQRAEPVSALSILAEQFRSLVVLLLVAAACVALLLGDALEAAAIGAVLAVNAIIGFAVELRAKRAMDALLRYEVPLAKVLRRGKVVQVSSDLLVPGDVVALEEGDRVPADARILEATELRANEASLTGESLPVRKRSEPVRDPGTLLADRRSMVYAGTAVYAGRASAIVVATGTDTELGRIGTLVSQIEAGRTPLETRLDELGRRLVLLTLALATTVAVLGILRGVEIGRMVETGIALAIAAVPEGLPAVATIALAVGLRRMARRQAVVRRLSAVEALGSTTVVCADKTGTLTAGAMTVTNVIGAGSAIRVSGIGYSPEGEFLGPEGPLQPSQVPWLRGLCEAAALTSRATLAPDGIQVVGDPTDAALGVLAKKAGVDVQELLARLPPEGDIPFSSARRASASIHRRSNGTATFVKGAPATVLDWCSKSLAESGVVALDTERRAEILADNERMAERGLRVIALASGEGPRLSNLTFLGLAGIVDPPAEGVQETIAVLRGAGIRTVMITGDQRATAQAVAQHLGTLDGAQRTVDGRELREMTDEELREAYRSIGAFSRVSPEQKLRIVSALQARGEIVAMLGDGVNDAAALRKADIGVAMGIRGTDVAKETADVVLQDDRFYTIGAAVEQGRVIFDNIRKFVFYLFSCNLAEVLVLLLASLAGLPLPLLPLQILWLNLVTDTFPALALALEPSEPDVMERPPRQPDAAILSHRFLRAIAWYAGLITAATLGAYVWGLDRGDPAFARTIAFMTLALAQLFHLGTARSREPVLRWSRIVANRWAAGAVALVVALQLGAVYWAPLAGVLRTVPLTGEDWLVVLVLSALPAVVGQAIHLARSAGRPGAEA